MDEEEKIVEQNEASPAETEEAGETAEQFSFDSLKPKIKPVWKVIFAIVLLACIGVSLYFSFNALALDKYEYDETENGWELIGFHNDGSAEGKVVAIDHVMEKKGVVWTKNEDKPITSIKQYAFCCDNDVEIIKIGKTVTHIDDLAFYSCKNLQAVLVDPNNPSYSSENGILYSKDKTELLLFPIAYVNYADNPYATGEGENRSMIYALPETVTKIGPLGFAYAKKLTGAILPARLETLETLAFFRCDDLTALDLPNGLKKIGSDAFSYCKKLTYMYLPSSVEEIGHHAFYECAGLTEIDVGMSEDAFKKISLGDYWKNTSLLTPIALHFDRERRQV